MMTSRAIYMFLSLLLVSNSCAEANLVRRLRQEPAVCSEIRKQGIKGDFSQCKSENGNGREIPNQNGGICNKYNENFAPYMERRANCQRDQGCQWHGPPGTDQAKHFCQANPCFRINNNRCTIQNTGGRCVWWRKEDNLKFFGRNFPGCYQSPCQHPIQNNAQGCQKPNTLVPFEHWGKENEQQYAEPSPYQCVWCRGGWGCQNAKLTSVAQCYNIGNVAQCSRCNGKLGQDCNSDCRKHCCQSPYCTCSRSVGTREETGIDILTR